MFIALPCTTFSAASGGYHFKKSYPVTSSAIESINILIKIWQLTQYFQCPFIIENPAGGLINNRFFKAFFKCQVTRLPLGHFGYPTVKKTDLFYNFNMLLMVPQAYRLNNRYASQSLDNLSYRQKVTYPESFCDFIAENVINSTNLTTRPNVSI